MLAGALELQMSANIARLIEDMANAKKVVGSAMKEIESAVGHAKEILGALGIGLGLEHFAGLIKEAIDATDRLRSLSIITGITVEKLSELRQVADLSGTNIDAVALSMERLAKSLAGSGMGAGQAAKAFTFLGGAGYAAQLQTMSLADAQKDIAVKLEGYANSGTKVALVQAIMSKSGAELIPYLHEHQPLVRHANE